MAPPTKRQRRHEPSVDNSLNDQTMHIDPRLLDPSMQAATSSQPSTAQAAQSYAPQAVQPPAPVTGQGDAVRPRGPFKEKLDELVRTGMIEVGDDLRYSIVLPHVQIDASVIITDFVSSRLSVAITSTASPLPSLPATDAAFGQAATQSPTTLRHLHYSIQGPQALQTAVLEAHGITAAAASPRNPAWKRFQVCRNGEDLGTLHDLRENLYELRAKGDKDFLERVAAKRKRRGPARIQSADQRVARGLENIVEGMKEMQAERNEGVAVAAKLYELLAELKGNVGEELQLYYGRKIQSIANATKRGIWAEVTGATEGGVGNEEGGVENEEGGDGGDIEE